MALDEYDIDAVAKERDYIFSKLYYFYDKRDRSKLDFTDNENVVAMSQLITFVMNHGIENLNEKLKSKYEVGIKESEYNWPARHAKMEERNLLFARLMHFYKKNKIEYDTDNAAFETLLTYAMENGIESLNKKLVGKYGVGVDK